jgi:hypothetical protein
MIRRDRDADRDIRATRDQDNYNNFHNWKTSREIGDTESARHWRDNWLGEVGRDRDEEDE